MFQDAIRYVVRGLIGIAIWRYIVKPLALPFTIIFIIGVILSVLEDIKEEAEHGGRLDDETIASEDVEFTMSITNGYAEWSVTNESGFTISKVTLKCRDHFGGVGTVYTKTYLKPGQSVGGNNYMVFSTSDEQPAEWSFSDENYTCWVSDWVVYRK